MANLQFFSAWVSSTQNTWDASYARQDEDIVSFQMEHDEGQIPKLTMQIRNPRIGLLSSPNYWFWLSYSSNGGAAAPIFFGRLVGIPTSILANVIEVQLVARPTDYIYQKQKVAETLKTLPNYDPIFLDVSKRDDPDAILEGWSMLYHVDRVTNQVTVSDILIGEDAVVSICPEDVPYDSVQMKVGQSPLVAVNVKVQVTWEQTYRGFFNVGSWAYPTLGGDAFVGDWPKTGAALGGGYSASISWAGERDPGIEAAMLAIMPAGAPSVHYEWHNTARHHEYGDTMSIVYDYQAGIGGSTTSQSTVNSVTVWEEDIIGILNPFTVDAGGNPDPTNIPAHNERHFISYRTFALDFLGKQSLATLGITYAPNRKRVEQLEFTLQADVQPILIDPLVTEDTEQIVLKSGDLSMPMIDLLNWDSVAGQAVAVGQMVFPDNPLVPGQTSTQIAVAAGTAGTTEPVFSNVSGVTTVDGTVTWSSLGVTQPVEQTQDWVRSQNVPLGAMVLPKPISGLPDMGSLLAPGQLNYPPTGVAVTTFEMFTAGLDYPGCTIYEVTQAGFIGGLTGGGAPPTPPLVPGGPIIIPPPINLSIPNSQAVTQTFTNPTGMFLYVCVKSGQTGLFHTTFDETYGSQTTDGAVVWQNVGQVSLAIGGWPGMTPARSYFPSDRGQQSLQHMLLRARGKLRKRARAVTVSFDTTFEIVAGLSCRMSAGIADARLPGGQAYGKVISYKLIADGDSGRVYGNVAIGCSVGNYGGSGAARSAGGVRPALASGGVSVTGTPDYVVAPGYVLPGYQVYNGAVTGVPIAPPAGQGAPPPGHAPPGGNTSGAQPSNPVNSVTGIVACPSPPPMTEPTDAIGYAPPVEFGNDDGLVFPASPNDLILKSAWHGIASTLDPFNIQAYNELVNTTVSSAVQQANSTRSGPVSAVGGAASETVSVPQTDWGAIANAVEQAVIKSLDQGHGLWYELVMRPLTNGPFGSAYVVTTTTLPIVQTINLSAPSSGG